MFRALGDFVRSYKYETSMTGAVLDCLTDENLNQKVADGYRNLGAVAWHIVATIPEMMAGIGLDISAVDHEAPPPAKASEIVDGYRSAVAELFRAAEGKWGDEDLLEDLEMYGQKMPRGKWISSFVAHEVHHRGQLTILLRQAGVENVPGVYGPSLQEWANFGMDVPAY